jgi:hypothetical protein
MLAPFLVGAILPICLFMLMHYAVATLRNEHDDTVGTSERGYVTAAENLYKAGHLLDE